MLTVLQQMSTASAPILVQVCQRRQHFQQPTASYVQPFLSRSLQSCFLIPQAAREALQNLRLREWKGVFVSLKSSTSNLVLGAWIRSFSEPPTLPSILWGAESHVVPTPQIAQMFREALQTSDSASGESIDPTTFVAIARKHRLWKWTFQPDAAGGSAIAAATDARSPDENLFCMLDEALAGGDNPGDQLERLKQKTGDRGEKTRAVVAGLETKLAVFTKVRTMQGFPFDASRLLLSGLPSASSCFFLLFLLLLAYFVSAFVPSVCVAILKLRERDTSSSSTSRLRRNSETFLYSRGLRRYAYEGVAGSCLRVQMSSSDHK